MSRPSTYEQSLFNKIDRVLSGYSKDFSDRMLVIEACASLYGGFDINSYWRTFGIKCSDESIIMDKANELFKAINEVGVAPSMVISSVSREPIPVSEMKSQGAFYTDFRLAEFVASNCEKYIKKKSKLVDLASGSGILLAGVAEKYYGKYPKDYEEWLAKCVYAYDLSANALRGARAALSVHISSIEIIKKMCEKWVVCDSLFSDVLDNEKYDIVVGNPPWGKTKITLHDFVNSSGANHTYGSEYESFDNVAFENRRLNQLEYSKQLKKQYSLLGNAEPDMYMAFMQRALSVVKVQGHLEYIVPAGLIRSQGTEPLRRQLIREGGCLKYYLIDNKAHFFEIDSRFKFVVVSLDRAVNQSKGCSEIALSMCVADKKIVKKGEDIIYKIHELEGIRKDLTIPECRSEKEKKLLFKIYCNGIEWKESWKADVCREVDMTNNRKDFHYTREKDDIPVIEGRMVQQFRFGAKAYVSGSGRSATWIPSIGTELNPQFYMSMERMSVSLKERIKKFRVGYCDIAGQTNERAMMSALIPPMVVCGNKVPTIVFNVEDNDYPYLWLGITNSFVFDWLLRRIISTTVNYFLLYSMPMPNIEINNELSQKIVAISKKLCEMKEEFYKGREMAELRAKIDILVAKAFGLDFSDIELIMEDFPLLDRSQRALTNENRSTVTRDLFLSLAEKEYSQGEQEYTKRYEEECRINAKAYIPSEMVGLCK